MHLGKFDCIFNLFFFRILLASSKLEECWSEHHGEIKTSECARNTYTLSYGKKTASVGKRIDHILYRSGAGFEV